MKKIVTIVLLGAVAASCNKGKEEMLSRAAIQAKVDSIVGSKIPEISRMAMEDLDRRMAIEVKPKADSMVQAWEAQMKKDTTTAPAANKPAK